MVAASTAAVAGACLALVWSGIAGCGASDGAVPGGSGADCVSDDECRGRCRWLEWRRACADECADESECPAGWTCREGLCDCTPAREDCNSLDDDCDGRVDEGLEVCGGECVDVRSDARHCGGCGMACAETQVCAMGSCCTPSAETCNGIDDDCDGSVDEHLALCDGECTDLSSDEAHCGDCGFACGDGLICSGGTCCIRYRTVPSVHLLFVVDNSYSMAEEQASLAEQLPRMMAVLTTGDLDGDGSEDFEPFGSIHAGVVTSDMGAGGFDVPTCRDSDFGDDGILRTRGDTTDPECLPTYPSFLEYGTGRGYDPEDFGRDVACVAQAGTRGCGFEQPLEAVLKAVTPSTAPIRFSMDSTGHADGVNAGFLRTDAVLAVILLTDEDDCSTRDLGLLDPASTTYEGNLSLRCFTYPDALHPIGRYVDGLVAAKLEPGALVYGLIGGVPVELVEEGATYDEILADDRMQQRIDASDPNRLAASCGTEDRGFAVPPRRMVRVAQALEDRGALTTVQSICQADLGPAVDAILRAIADADVEHTGYACPR